MHIIEGSLAPGTYTAAFAVTVPFWAVASKKLGKSLHSKQVPVLALSAAFCFVIMMFNIPIPGGTTGHAVGAVLAAILLGPWAACIAVSIALIVQAVVFGDGGITCIGANCLNMAIIMPFTGYWVYRLIAGRSDFKSKRRAVAAAIGGYVGLNAAALAMAFELGWSSLARDSMNRALYSPYPMRVTIPAVTVGHLLVFGVLEAVITGLLVGYLQRVDVTLLQGYKGELS